MRPVQYVASVTGRSAHRVVFCVIKLLAQRKRFDGITVYAFGDDAPSALTCMESALRCLEATEPIWMDRIRRRLKAFMILDQGGPGFYPETRICVFSARYLREVSTYQVALDIVHETMHACLHGRGFAYVGERRDRIERACVRAEARLARRFPGEAVSVDWVEHKVRDPWWSEARTSARRDLQLRRLGVPEWFRRILSWIRSVGGSN